MENVRLTYSTIIFLGILLVVAILPTNRDIESSKQPNEQIEVISEQKAGTIREVSAYNAGDINQTDSSPCISANGENICLALEQGYKRCAANFVPLGTDLIIQYYGECKVTDRMNSRYSNSVDIAMKLDEYERAIKFGRQKLLVTIK